MVGQGIRFRLTAVFDSGQITLPNRRHVTLWSKETHVAPLDDTSGRTNAVICVVLDFLKGQLTLEDEGGETLHADHVIVDIFTNASRALKLGELSLTDEKRSRKEAQFVERFLGSIERRLGLSRDLAAHHFHRDADRCYWTLNRPST